MHRHYVDPTTGTSTDILLITQTATDLHRSIREVVETSLRFAKLKAIGRPDSYKVEVYLGCRMRRSDISSTYVRRYDPKIFKIYKSYDSSGVQGAEAVVDDRVSIFRGNRMRLIIVAAIVLLIICPYALFSAYRAFVPERDATSKEAVQVNSTATVIPSATQAAFIPPSAPRLSESRRLVGVIKRPDGLTDLIIRDGDQLSIESGQLAAADTYITEAGDVLWLAPPI